jgi:hypothetical protein
VLFMQKHWDVLRSDERGRPMEGSEREPARATSASSST